MKKDTHPPRDEKASSYYDLHTGAVDDLVSAKPENTPRYAKAELEKYRSHRFKWRVPQGLKAVLIKWWFYGAMCFFVFMGLGMYSLAQLDLMFVGAIIMGMVTDLLINHFLRFTEQLPGGSARWMMVTRRGAAGFLMNLLYGFVLMFLVVTLYNAVNTFLFALLGGTAGAPLLSVEPILFGLFATGADTLCLMLRNTAVRMLRDARGK